MTPEGFVFINKRQANQLQMSRLVGSQPQLQTQELRVFVEAHSVQAKLGAVEESRIPQQGQFVLRGFPANLWVLFKSWGIPKSPWVSILTWSDWCSKKGTVGFISMYNLTIIIHHLTSSNNPFFFYSHIFDGYSCYQPQRMEKVVHPHDHLRFFSLSQAAWPGRLPSSLQSGLLGVPGVIVSEAGP